MAKILNITRNQKHKFVQCWKCRSTALIDKTTGLPMGKENEPSCWIRLYIEKKMSGFMNAPSAISAIRPLDIEVIFM